MKQNKKIIMLCAIGICLIAGFIINSVINPYLGYSQEYIAGQGNIKGNVDVSYFKNISDDFDIGANKYGYAVFKNPEKALERLKENYKDGIKLIQSEYDLQDLSQDNYKIYGTYGWQVSTGSEKEKEEAGFVSYFMDIYENSFEIVK